MANQAAAAPSTATAPANPPALAKLTGVFAKVDDATKAIEVASKRAHIVSPSAVIPRPPEGCEIAIAAIYVDVTNECYPTGGKSIEVTKDGKTEKKFTEFFGLGKTALQRIGLNAGVTWLSSKRVDDRRDPLYVEWEAWARIIRLDGSVQDLPGNVTIDLRKGSAQIDAIEKRTHDGKNAEKQVRDMRLFITRHAESKAKLRAIRDLGIRTSYTLEELKKPFIAVSLVFTGTSDDPELKRMFAVMRAERMLGATSSLYGAAPTSAGMQPARPPVHQGGASVVRGPAPIDTTAEDLDDDAPASSSSAGVEAAAKTAAAGRVALPGKKGKPVKYVDSADEDDLRFWEKRIAENLEKDPDGRYAEKDRGILAAIQVELARRSGGDSKPAAGGAPMTEEEKAAALADERAQAERDSREDDDRY